MMASRLRFGAALTLTIQMMGTGVAAAEPTAADREAARDMMAEGRTARKNGDLRAAMRAFSAADAIMHVPTTGLELARTQAALGQLLEARETLVRVIHFPEKPNEPAPFTAAREAAVAFDAELESRTPSLRVVVVGASGGAKPSVTLDGTVLPAEALEVPRRVNPGHHLAFATAGRAEGGQQIDVAEGESKQVTIELGASNSAAAGLGGEPSVAEEPRGRGDSSALGRGFVYGGFGVAGVGVIVGSIAGLASMSKTNDIRHSGQCIGDACGPAEYSDIRAANTMATISTVSFAVAGAGAVAGLVALLVSSRSDPAPEAPPLGDASKPSARLRPNVQPWVGPGALGLRGQF
jgi:hypothetical protein